MNQGRFWGAAFAGGVTLFVAGFLLWGLVFAGFYEAHAGTATGVNKETVDFFHLFLGQFFWGLFLAVVIGRYAGVTGFGAGLKIGALMGFLVTLSIALTQFSMANLHDLTVTLTDPFISAVWSGLGGGVVGLVMAGGKATPASPS